jgi:hypothetical protein
MNTLPDGLVVGFGEVDGPRPDVRAAKKEVTDLKTGWARQCLARIRRTKRFEVDLPPGERNRSALGAQRARAPAPPHRRKTRSISAARERDFLVVLSRRPLAGRAALLPHHGEHLLA